MPNHLHGIVVIAVGGVGASRRFAPTEHTRAPAPNSIGAIMAQCKSIVTKRVNTMRDMQGTPLWQRNYYEHIIRNDDDMDRIRQYIIDNPVNWASDENNPRKVR